MFSLAIKSGQLGLCPHIPMPDVNNARKGFFEEEAFRAVLTHSPEEMQAVVKKLTGHKTEADYRPYDIVEEKDLYEGVKKLAAFHSTMKKSDQRSETEQAQSGENMECSEEQRETERGCE